MTPLRDIGLLLCTAVACVLPMTASAGAPPKPPTVEQRVAALESAVADLHAQVAKLQTENAAQQQQINAVQNVGKGDTGR
jgi:outer membrane murein-binding lipoprotein Lpp